MPENVSISFKLGNCLGSSLWTLAAQMLTWTAPSETSSRFQRLFKRSQLTRAQASNSTSVPPVILQPVLRTLQDIPHSAERLMLWGNRPSFFVGSPCAHMRCGARYLFQRSCEMLVVVVCLIEVHFSLREHRSRPGCASIWESHEVASAAPSGLAWFQKTLHSFCAIKKTPVFSSFCSPFQHFRR